MKTWNLIMAAVLAAGLCAGQARAIDSAGSGYWDVGTTWVGGNMPTSADDVVIKAGHTVTNQDMVTREAKSLTIENTAVLTHTPHASGDTVEKYKVILSIVSNLTIDAGGEINADGRGYAAERGPGAGYAASHGGNGGCHDTYNTPGLTCGSITAPTNCGSGGAAGAGGGAVVLTVGGASTVHGVISACGSPVTYHASSGGAVFLTTATLTGSGTLKAEGAAASGGGGGGRIAVILTNSTDFGGVRMTAYGGYAASGSHGAPGTVYLEKKGDTAGQGTLIVDGNDMNPGDSLRRAKWLTVQNGLGASTYAFSELILTNRAQYALDANDVLDIASTTLRVDPSDRIEGICLNGGTLRIPSSDLAFMDYFLLIGEASSTFDPALTSVTVGTNANLRIDVPYMFNGDVTILAGGVMGYSGHGGVGETRKLNLTVNGNLDIRTNGQINVDGLGYGSGQGPGAAAAGAYGGQGGMHAAGQTLGMTYGSVTAPTNWGSGGLSEAGGGAVRLNVSGTTTVNGLITASGPDGNHYRGSGGSVFLTTGSLAGNGTAKANGGSYDGGACGGGGRVAVILTNSTDFANVALQAYGGTGSYFLNPGSAGTVYRQHKGHAAGRGLLTVDNNNVTVQDFSATLVSLLVTDTTVGSVVITNMAKFAVSNQALTVHGDLLNKGVFRGLAQSTVEFAGTNAATVQGNVTYYHLTCTNAGKVLSFEDGKTNTVDGVLTLLNCAVDSIGGVNQWLLKASAFTHSVSNVTAGRSDARPGSQITAYDSTDLGGNSNWVFTASGPQINRWTGTVDTDWKQNGNWSQGRPTVESDDVVIPGGCMNYPLLDFDKRVKSLAISNGASLNMAGYNLTVDEDTRVAGILNATGTELLTLRGDLDFSGGGTFNAASSSVWVAGSAAQTVVSAGNAFFLLTVSNSLAPVVFADAVTASNLVNMANPVSFGGAVTVASLLRTYGTNVSFAGALTAGALDNRNGALVCSGAVTVATFTNWAGDLTFRDDVTAGTFYSAPGKMTHTFRDGKTVTVGSLEWYGRGGYPIMLRSVSDGSAWNLNVTSGSKVRQVDVRDSDASPGQTIRPVAGVNSGNNTNWVFSSPWHTWDGSESSSFTDENNWTPAGVPGGDKLLLIDGYYSTAPVLSGVATSLQVIVGSVTTATLTVNGELATLGDVEVLPRGTITHSANASTETYKMCLTVGSNLTVHGAINVDGKGYQANSGPGTANAGAYGGQGGEHAADRKSVGTTYGSVTSPTNCGSGGWSDAGGGVVRAVVTGTTTVNGVISASGVDGSYYRGSGGSVFLTTGALAGSGTVRADGGSYSGGGCGGGGRVAVYVTNSTSFGNVKIQARGGTGDSTLRHGSAGTVYLQHKDQTAGQGILILDNNNQTTESWSTTLIGPLVKDTAVGTVIITNQAKLAISNQVLTAQGEWVNRATFIAMTNSTVDFAGAGAATIWTNNTFFNLTCTNAGKTLSFEAGKTNTVNGLLKLGASQSGQTVTLQSTTPGSWSYLTLTPGGTQQIARVSVKDNNAGGGQKLLAGGGSVNGGNNINWQFPPSGTMFMVK